MLKTFEESILNLCILAPGLCNLPAERVMISKIGLFGFRCSQKPNVLRHGRLNLDPFPSGCRFCLALQDALVPITGSAFLVSLLMVIFIYATVHRETLTLVHRCLGLMCTLPDWSKETATRSLPHRENEHHYSDNNCSSCILGNLCWDRLQTVINDILASLIRTTESEMLPATSCKYTPSER